MQYEVIESTGISNISIKKLLWHEKTKQGLKQFFEKQVINHLKSEDISFAVAGNGRTHIKKSNGTIDVASNNHKESDTLMHYCLGLVDLENKVVCVKSNEVDAFTIMLGNYEKLNGLTLLIVSWSNEKWIKLTKVYELLGAEKAKRLICFHCFSGCAKFTLKSKDAWTKLFLNSDLDVLRRFNYYLDTSQYWNNS